VIVKHPLRFVLQYESSFVVHLQNFVYPSLAAVFTSNHINSARTSVIISENCHVTLTEFARLQQFHRNVNDPSILVNTIWR